MQSKERNSDIRKVIVRNSEKRNAKGIARREFNTDLPLTLEDTEGLLNDSEEPSSTSDVAGVIIRPYSKISDISKSIDESKDISTNLKVVANEKASKRLNFPFDEVIYQDLISLNEIKKVKPDEFSKHLDRPRRLRKLDPEPKLSNFFKPIKQEFLFRDYQVNVEACDGHQNFQFERVSESDEPVIYNRDIDAEEQSDSDYPVIHKGKTNENVQEDLCYIERLKERHGNFGLNYPRLKSYFEGCTLHKKSQAWKVYSN